MPTIFSYLVENQLMFSLIYHAIQNIIGQNREGHEIFWIRANSGQSFAEWKTTLGLLLENKIPTHIRRVTLIVFALIWYGYETDSP